MALQRPRRLVPLQHSSSARQMLLEPQARRISEDIAFVQTTGSNQQKPISSDRVGLQEKSLKMKGHESPTVVNKWARAARKFF